MTYVKRNLFRFNEENGIYSVSILGTGQIPFYVAVSGLICNNTLSDSVPGNG